MPPADITFVSAEAGSSRSPDRQPEGHAWTADEAYRQARAMFDIAGVPIGNRKLSRLVRGFRANAAADEEFGTWLRRADPTAELAVWRVLQTACSTCGRQLKQHRERCVSSPLGGDAA